MGSGGMIYIPSFIKIDSGVQRLLGAAGMNTSRHADIQIHTARKCHKPTFNFSK
jgi:hypothetical protein